MLTVDCNEMYSYFIAYAIFMAFFINPSPDTDVKCIYNSFMKGSQTDRHRYIQKRVSVPIRTIRDKIHLKDQKQGLIPIASIMRQTQSFISSQATAKNIILFIYSDETNNTEWKARRAKLLINEWKTLFNQGVGDIVLRVSTRTPKKSILKVHYTASDPRTFLHLPRFCLVFWLWTKNGNSFLRAKITNRMD